MKSLRIFLVVMIATIIALSLFSASGILAQTPTPTPTAEDPTDEEKKNFNDKLTRLNASCMPIPVNVEGPGNDVIDSLTGPVTKTFDCPGCQESLVKLVTVTITTTHVHWDPTLIPEEKRKEGAGGYYLWVVKSKWVECGDKIITCDNLIMLDPAVTKADEANPPIGTLADEGLLYHELLHGQLLINAMDTPAWQTKACNCEFDLEPMDVDHSEIYPAVDGYSDCVAAGIADVKIVEPPAQPADGDGNFDIELCPTEKTEWQWSILEPTGGSNVDEASVTVEVIDGKFHVKGKLRDKSKKGKFFIRIDPEDEWIIGGLENALVVLPPGGVGGIVVPVDKFALLAPYIALASTIIVTTAATTIYVKRRKKKTL